MDIAQEKAALEDELKYLRDSFQKILNNELLGFPAEYRSLIAKLPLQEQWEWIQKNKDNPAVHIKEPSKPTWEEVRGIPAKPKTPVEQLAERIKEVQKNKDHPHIDQIV